MSRICPGGLLSCSLYLSEQKSKAEKTRKSKRVVICKQFFPASLPVACQSTAGEAIIFPPKINECVLPGAYYAFPSYVRREGHLYDVFLVFDYR